MIPGLSGSLLSHDAMAQLLRGKGPLILHAADRAAALRTVRGWHGPVRKCLGPSAGARVVFDLVADPLARALGFLVIPLGATAASAAAVLQAGGTTAAVMIATPWGQPAGAAWRDVVHLGLAHGVRWGLSVNGPAVRLVDADRAYSRRYAEFDLDSAADNETTFSVLWGVLRAAALVPCAGPTALDRTIAFCEDHRAEVRASLRRGVHDAVLTLSAAFRRIAAPRHANAAIMDESLIVVYRVLFLLFAEARGLVPAWHPVYRDGYTVESLRRKLRPPGNPTGVWETLQAIARLAHRGCRAGTLRVPPFNGRLFSPSDAPLADTLPLDDRVVSRALTSLTTHQDTNGRREISYSDLGVEQLGGVYEHLLDYDLAAAPRGSTASLVATGRRKASGSFYTPRSLTEFVVRRALSPLVRDATPEQILRLRVLDPAMGSGAFLVAACRYLAVAYEHALSREGTLVAEDIGEDDRAAFRRVVAQRCLFGVDLNPMAVQLGRLSLWLATLAADRPLTFLDHHLRAGNSLVGASMEDVQRQHAPGGAARPRNLPLFDADGLQRSIRASVGSRLSLAETPDDTLDQVRGKERTLGLLKGAGGPLERWTAAADLWCAAWFEAQGRSAQPVFRTLLDRVLRDASALPAHLADPLLARAKGTAQVQRFFHWRLEFPEVFYEAGGNARTDAGFDAIVGNPPWDMLREDGATRDIADLQRYARGSGQYTLQGSGHTNLYQLFLERAMRLLKPRGRAGLILPGGVATDHGSALLRRFLLEATSIDTFTVLENREAIFPIHRSLKFVLVTFTNSGSTTALPLRGGVRSADVLDRTPDSGDDPLVVSVPRDLLEKVSGVTVAVPDIRTHADLDILSSITARVPALGDGEGWHVHFGRELNATEARPHFTSARDGLPIVEGKQIRPFGVDLAASRCRIAEHVAAKLLKGSPFHRRRLAYRDVSSPTNRMTLIAAIVPAGAVTTHTLFCMKETLEEEAQQYLCGVFNSCVANYLVRMRVGTHVTTAVMARLPVPRPSASSTGRREVVMLSRALCRRVTPADAARLNAVVARLYGLTATQFSRVLETFPLVAAEERAAALRLFQEGPNGEGDTACER